MIHSIHEKYDVRDRMYIQSSELMYYQLYYDDQSVGTDSWGEPVAQSFNHNGTINGTRTVYNWDHTTMPSTTGMEGALLYGYQYDRLNRLLRADAIVEDYVATQSGSNLYNCYGIGDVNVNYDPVGNIRQILRTLPETYAMGTLQLQHLNFAVGSTHNQVSEVTDLFAGPRVFTYDVNGNLISDSKNGVLQTDIGRSSYPYQLKGIHPATSESIQYTYLYDTDDSRIFKRIEKGSALQMEYYLKDIGIYDMTSDKWTYFVQGDDRIAKVFPQNYQSPGQNAANTDLKVSQGMANFYEYDHLGNTRIVYSVRDIHNGTTSFDIHFAADYYPYGKTLRYFETAAFEEKFLTTQHERDRETGFDYRGARYYDSDLGRFLSLDPLAAKFPAWSAYNYVLGNPVKFTDPDGKEPEDIIFKGQNKKELKRAIKFQRKNDSQFNATYNQWKSDDNNHILSWQTAPLQTQIDRGTNFFTNTWDRQLSNGDVEHHFSKQRIRIAPPVNNPINLSSNSGVGAFSQIISNLNVNIGALLVKYNMNGAPDRLRITSDDGGNAVNYDSGSVTWFGRDQVNVTNFTGNLNVSVNGAPQEQGRETIFSIVLKIVDFNSGEDIFTHQKGALRKARKNGFTYN
ncbi:hypothetical protein GCM10009118_14330 [Wandonia haliotis]|uniref:RHS repeat-associated core domain-containing protein n=1 Tax=Wandonia haliotis TaxID=574963 RepID=A0ABN1MQ94_9FLAO